MSDKRSMCKKCLRPTRTCLCDLVQTVQTRTQLVIWQHPAEKNHPKGSAQLLHLCLNNSVIYSGEYFCPEDLGLISDHCVLLYPDDKQEAENKQAPEHKQNSELTPSAVRKNTKDIRQILLLDGTWRKSRRLMYTNPWLTELRRMSLGNQEGLPSITGQCNKQYNDEQCNKGKYKIRKSEKPHQLSSFEAGAQAISTLEQAPYFDNTLASVFDAFIARWESYLPK